MHTGTLAHPKSRVLWLAAEAFRYFMLERAEPQLRAHDEALLGPGA